MTKKILNEYAIRSPDRKLFQQQMKQRYIRSLGRKNGRKKNTFAVENETYDTVRQDRRENTSQPSDYAEEKITDSGAGLITYSRDQAVFAGRKSVSKRAEKKRAEESIKGASAEVESIVNPQASENSNSVMSGQRIRCSDKATGKSRSVRDVRHEGYGSLRSTEAGRMAFQKKAQISAFRNASSGTNASGVHLKPGVNGVKTVVSRISASLKASLEAGKKSLASFAAVLGCSSVVLVVVSVILVMSLILCSSFGEYDLELSDNDLVNIALTQVGTESGEEYWSWYGFDHEVGWCACFVSWCANEAGMIKSGTMPKFAWCPSGALWFQSRDQWLDGSTVPEPGMIIFYDWYDDTLDEDGEPIGQDGEADHVGIVEKVESGRIYTVEGNTTDQFICAEKTCPVGYFEILGYGCPEF